MLVTTKCTKDNVGWRTNDRKHSFDLNRTSSYPPTNISLADLQLPLCFAFGKKTFEHTSVRKDPPEITENIIE